MTELGLGPYFIGLAFLVLVVIVLVRLIVLRRERPAEGAAKWNNYAIGAFVFAWFVPLIPLVLGIASLVQITATGERGRFLAVAALVIQGAGIVSFGFYSVLHGR